MFGNNLDVKLKNISTISASDNKTYYLTYNEEPDIEIGFYANSALRNFKYVDAGYRVTDKENKTLYRADKSNIEVKSTKDGDTINYEIDGDLQNVQNVSMIEKARLSLVSIM